MIGRQLSHFRIVGELGSGGMGVAYRAVDIRLGRPVALKLLPPDTAAEPGQQERLLLEAQAASALNHPNIVTVYEVDSVEGTSFIAMELVEGLRLDQLIPASGLAFEQAIAYAIPIAEALERAHAAGIIHRDLKPRNVMVTRDGVVKVLDFGLAKRVGPEAIASGAATADIVARTRTGTLVGTPHYMSPEQVQGKPVDARSDVFALGVVLFEMLTGRRPFQGAGVVEVLAALLRDPTPSVRALRPELPAEAERIVAKALEKDPARRYQAMRDLLVELRARPGASRPSRTEAGRRPPGRGAWFFALVVVALTVVAWAGLRLRSRRPAAAVQFRLLSTFPGSHRSPSLSPDGRMVAFVDDVAGVAQVFVKYLESGDPVQVTRGDEPAARPRWSPKGDQILYERRAQGLWLVPPLGGQPRQLLPFGTCPAWFPDGERLVFDRGEELWSARLDGSEARRVEGIPVNYFSAYVKRCAVVSPDGRSLAYYQPERGVYGDFWAIEIGAGAPRRLTADSAAGGRLAWAPDGRTVVFASERRGSRTLWRVAVDGGEPEPVTTGVGEDDSPEFSPDGTRLVYSNARSVWSIVLFDALSGARRTLIERRSHLNGPEFSPDGNRVAFFATVEADGLEKIFTVGLEGDDLRQVAGRRGEALIMPRWSADGATLFFYRELPRASLMRAPVIGGPATVVIDDWRWPVQAGARPGPNDQTLLYALFEGGQPKATRLRDLSTGQERSLPRPLDWARWSRDGQRILGSQGLDILVCSVADGRCDLVGQGDAPCWSGDGTRIYARRNAVRLDDPNFLSLEVWEMGAQGGDPRRVASVASQHVVSVPFDVSVRDQIVWPEVHRSRQELWLAELGRR
jgi:Tol biopolymer transport system component